ncbi:histidine kinase dimerization/phosphoacceptor domain -containing protein [uncultured Algimonas sp.]|uniref:sensor histidine kinase n=1 Tax=uncultured Algimonas sp. TaxID=1547920 RepID=UPI0026105DF4|nr:histidine kinase dimerization/phosphoacceptor domain -containing protein [uncultured Algimonas sp.]
MSSLTPTTLKHAADPGIVRDMAGNSDTFVLSLFDSSPDCIQLVELDGSLAYMSSNGQHAMEIEDFGLVEGRPWVALWPDESQVKISLAIAAAKTGEASRIEVFRPEKSGHSKWWDVSVSPVTDAAGKVVRILSISRDITDVVERDTRLRDYETRLTELNTSLSGQLQLRDVLMREIDHRVKNSLSMIASILRLQSRDTTSDEAKSKLVSAAARVNTVARVHESLQSAADITTVSLDKYLPTIAEDVTDALTRNDVALTVDVEAVSMDSEMAVSLGMIAAELVTNAFKHAFTDRGGMVELVLHQTAPDNLRMSVRDNGRGGCVIGASQEASQIQAQMETGLGTRIVQLHVSQLGATMSCDSPPDGGTIFTLDIPA